MAANKKIIILTLVILFLVSLIRIAPFVYKGYAPNVTYDNLILSRNLAQEGVYKMESANNVLLSTSRVKNEGVESTLGNKLTIYLDAAAFKIFGFNQNLPFYVSIIMFAFSGVLLFLLILKLFGNYWLALSAFLIDLFMPFVWKGSLWPGFYEFASVFFLTGLLFYFWKEKKSGLIFVLSGIFLGLAVISRNAFMFSVIPLAVYEFYRSRSWKNLIFLVLPIIVVFVSIGIFNNAYLSSSDESFTEYGHLFPDPYTYHFERDAYIQSVASSNDPEILQFSLKYGYKVPFLKQVYMYLLSAWEYPKQVFSLINFGGPVFLFLALLGGFFLFRERKKLFYFVGFWLVFWYAGHVLMKTNNWDHFLEIRLALVLLITFGAWKLIEIFGEFYKNKKAKILFGSGLIVLLVLQLLFSDKWLFHEGYDTGFPEVFGIIEDINSRNISDSDIIAIGIHQLVPYILNYYTDKSFIYFAPETIEKLKKENRLEEVFKKFGVTRYLPGDACGFKK